VARKWTCCEEVAAQRGVRIIYVGVNQPCAIGRFSANFEKLAYIHTMGIIPKRQMQIDTASHKSCLVITFYALDIKGYGKPKLLF
jgi:hypothetical protein